MISKILARKAYFKITAKSSTINFWTIIADTFWIHAPYRIGEMRVKWKSKK